ncbi:MAG: cytochrome b/b6 domain-containing protein [Alphaproteobacteria bacterium]|nr:cytochrome b/b6 domain-containing protein [Alphaproteobacteria bacterium]
MTNKPALVWDIEIRIFHWLLLAFVVGAWLTVEVGPPSLLGLHEVLGFGIGAMLVFRLFWGLFGSWHQRFTSFVRGPVTVLSHLKSLLSGKPQRFVGHNPAGGVMIVALLVVLLGVVASGIATMGGFDKAGPLAPYLTFAQGRQAKEIHELLVNILLVLAGLHVAGVILESVLLKENLIRSMIHGRKEAHPAAVVPPGEAPIARPGLAAVLASLVVASLGSTMFYSSLKPALGVPMLGHNPQYVKECGACHTPHHPSLLPSSSWKLVMAGLSDHFGDDASLTEGNRQELESWLVKSSELGWDTKAGQRIPATLKADDPMRITASVFWERRHRKIPEPVFKSKLVGGKANCQACHVDAVRGGFSPLGIAIPEEIK